MPRQAIATRKAVSRTGRKAAASEKALVPAPQDVASANPKSPLDRYFRILEIVSSFPAGVTQSQIAEMIGLPKTTVHRLLNGLADLELVELGHRRSGLCKVGPRLVRMLYSGVPDRWLENLTYPILKGLADLTGEMCIVSKLSEKTVRVVAMVEPHNSTKGYVVPPRELWAHATASAKAILAFLPEDKALEILPSPLPALTSRTKTSIKAILDEYRQIRVSRVALCAGEDVPEFAAIACPVELPGIGVIYSVCIAGTMKSVVEENKAKYGELLKARSKQLSAAIQMKISQSQPSSQFS